MKRAAIIFALLPLLYSELSAQELKEVEVLGDRIHWSEGALIRDTSRIQFSKTTGDFLTNDLQMKSSLWIRTSAPGSYAQISYRGLSGNHTQVLWEGLPVNSPALGVTDLSSMSAGAIDQLSFGTGGSTGFQSGNSAGGVLLLSDNHSNNKPLAYLGLSYGSFNSQVVESGVHWTHSKHSHSLKFSYLSSDNDFGYVSPRGKDLQRQGADYQQYLLKYNYSLQLKKGTLDAAFWGQSQDLGIANNVLQTEMLQRQTDVFLRQFVRYTAKDFTVQAGWFYEEGDYVNPVSEIYDFNAAHSAMARAIWRLKPGKRVLLTLESDFLYHSVWGLSKAGERYQGVNAAHFQWNWKDKLHLDLGGRIDIASDGEPLTSLNSKVVYDLSYVELFTRADQVNRRPNLNDLYWFAGGNPNLSNETGVSFEAGVQRTFKKKEWQWTMNLSAFYYNIDGLIIWIPAENGIWSPQNVRKGKGQGVEAGGNIGYHKNDWKLALGIDYQYVWSEQGSDGNFGLSPGVPVHRIRGNVLIGYQFTHLQLAVQETSDWSQFQDQGQLGQLVGLSLYDLTLSHKYKWKSNACTASIIVRNIFDQEYSYQPFMPMPGINYSVKLLYELEHKNNKSKTKNTK